MNEEKRKKLLLWTCIGLLGFYFGLQFIIEPIFDFWAQQSKEISNIDRRLNQSLKLKSSEARVKKQLNSYIKQSLPSNRSKSEQMFIDSIQSYSRKHRLQIEAIKPQWKNSERDHQQIRCMIQSRCNLKALVSFLESIRKDELPIDILSLHIRKGQGQELQAQIELAAIHLKKATPKKSSSRRRS